MFIILIEKVILGEDGKFIVMAALVLPFPPWNGLSIRRPTETLELDEVTWDTKLGCFCTVTEVHLCDDEEVAEEVAADYIKSGNWGAVATPEDLEEIRKQHIKQAVKEFQMMIQKQQQQQIVVPTGPRRRGR